MGNKFIVIAFLILTFLSTSVSAATFKGRVIDADTKEPIEGAVVVAEWQEMQVGGHSRLKDVKETLTDKNGEWKIIGPRGREGGVITFIFNLVTFTYHTRPPLFIVFNPGYCPWPRESIIDVCKEKTKTYNFTNSKTIGKIVELPKLTKREDRLQIHIGPVGDNEDWEKQREFIRVLNEERRYLGWSEHEIIEGEANEK